MQNMEQYINQVIEGDCLDVMESFAPESIDMVLCDLPYGLTHNSWDVIIDFNRLWPQYKRIIRPQGVIVLTGQGAFTAQLILSNPAWFRYKLVWIKSRATNFLNVCKQPLRKHEDICVFYKDTSVYNPQKMQGSAYSKGHRNGSSENYNKFGKAPIQNLTGKRSPWDVLFYEEEPAHDYIYCKTASAEGKVFHPTQKPVTLGRYLIRTYSNPAAIVLDNACGSGSFLVAAVKENRQFIGIERNQVQSINRKSKTDYIQICRRRIEQAIADNQSSFPFNF